MRQGAPGVLPQSKDPWEFGRVGKQVAGGPEWPGPASFIDELQDRGVQRFIRCIGDRSQGEKRYAAVLGEPADLIGFHIDGQRPGALEEACLLGGRSDQLRGSMQPPEMQPEMIRGMDVGQLRAIDHNICDPELRIEPTREPRHDVSMRFEHRQFGEKACTGADEGDGQIAPLHKILFEGVRQMEVAGDGGSF